MEEQVTRATQAPKTSGVGCRTKFIFVLSDDKEDKTLTYHLPLPSLPGHCHCVSSGETLATKELPRQKAANAHAEKLATCN